MCLSIQEGGKIGRKEGREEGREEGTDGTDGMDGMDGMRIQSCLIRHICLTRSAFWGSMRGWPKWLARQMERTKHCLTNHSQSIFWHHILWTWYTMHIYIMYNSMCIYKHLCMFQRRLICIYLHAYPDTLHINVCMYTCIHGHGTHPKLTFLPWSAWLGKTYLSAMIYIIYTYCVNMFVSYIQCIYIYYML